MTWHQSPHLMSWQMRSGCVCHTSGSSTLTRGNINAGCEVSVLFKHQTSSACHNVCLLGDEARKVLPRHLTHIYADLSALFIYKVTFRFIYFFTRLHVMANWSILVIGFSGSIWWRIVKRFWNFSNCIPTMLGMLPFNSPETPPPV